MKKIKMFTVAFATVALTLLVPLATVSALDPFKGCSGSSAEVCKGNNDNLMSILESVINTLLLLIGIIAVIVIIVNGIRFATSDGDSNRVASARNGIIYAVVGIVVAMMAYAIVRFVVNNVNTG